MVISPASYLKGQFTILRQQFHEERGVDNLSPVKKTDEGRWLHLWFDFHLSSSYKRAWEERERKVRHSK